MKIPTELNSEVFSDAIKLRIKRPALQAFVTTQNIAYFHPFHKLYALYARYAKNNLPLYFSSHPFVTMATIACLRAVWNPC